MRLSQITSNYQNIKVIRDESFCLLGMGTSKFNRRGVLSFLADEKYTSDIINNSHIVAIITKEEMISPELIERFGIIVCNDPKYLFYELHNTLVEDHFYWKNHKSNIAYDAKIASTAIIAKDNVNIGSGTIIEDGVIIHEGTEIGKNVIIRSGSIIGSSGFQFLNLGEKVYPVKTGGKVLIYDNVEIQHNCCIDRGVLGGATELMNDVKIDNFVHIAHDCMIGKRTLITAGVKFGGRTVVGDDCWIGINATISNGLVIGNSVTVSLGSVVTKNVPDGMTVTGNFAIEHSKFLTFLRSIR